jgi:DNA invertase Pin-like site-specific DNA recombinase
LELIEEWNDLGVSLVSHQEAISMDSPLGKAMIVIVSALSAFENDVRRERIIAGIQYAKSQGKKLGRPRSVDRDLVRQMRSQGMSYQQIQQTLGIGRGGVYRALQGTHQNIVAGDGCR